MPRTARKVSSTGIYHIAMKGVGSMIIFEDDSDRRLFLRKLQALCDDGCLTVYAWCLLDNHFHILVSEGSCPIGDTVKRLAGSYARHFNAKTGHVGHVFKSRFLSKAVEDDEYFLTAVRYIHDNPVKAKIARRETYYWSSYREYVGTPFVTDTSTLLDMIDGPEHFEEFSNQASDIVCKDILNPTNVLSDKEALSNACELFGNRPDEALNTGDKSLRDERLRMMRNAGISPKQAQRITGLGLSTIYRAYRGKKP